MRSPLTPPISILQLRTQLNGRLVTPDDPVYDKVRTIFYGGFDHRPQLIVQAADAADVALSSHWRAIPAWNWRSAAAATARPGTAQATGIVLDLSAMRGSTSTLRRVSLWAQPGLTAGEYTTAAAAHRLATGFGDTGSVGIGGITLAGGVGFLVEKHGLTIDNLLAVEVVTADGELLNVDADNHPNLFWALRGGGGNFGVATRFQFRLHPLDQIVGGMLLLRPAPRWSPVSSPWRRRHRRSCRPSPTSWLRHHCRFFLPSCTAS